MPGNLPTVKYKYIVLVEPSLITQDSWKAHLEDRQGALKFLTKATMKRRDTWNSREEAKDYFEPRLPWNTWDPRILDIYVVSSRARAPLAKRCSLTCASIALWVGGCGGEWREDGQGRASHPEGPGERGVRQHRASFRGRRVPQDPRPVAAHPLRPRDGPRCHVGFLARHFFVILADLFNQGLTTRIKVSLTCGRLHRSRGCQMPLIS